MTTITIPGNTPSLKNSKQIVWRYGQPRITASRVYKQWFMDALPQVMVQGIEPITEYPVRVDFHFFRANKRLFDFINLMQGPLDLLVEAEILKADDMRYVYPGQVDWTVDKENPRVEMVIQRIVV